MSQHHKHDEETKKAPVLGKLKDLLHLNHGHHAQSESHLAGHAHDKSDPVAVHDDIRSKRAEHERKEREADQQIHEREVEEALERPHPTPNNFQPPIVTNARGPLGLTSASGKGVEAGAEGAALSSFEPRPALDEVAHPHQHTQEPHQALPDTSGYRHIPEKELHPASAPADNTALRPSSPNDPLAMDGAGEPHTAGDDRML